MDDKTIDRREFLGNSARTCIAVCGMCACSQLSVFAGDEQAKEKELLDPAKLNYCGYVCPAGCQFLKGTLENNVELKKVAFKLWKIEERFGVEFDPEVAICYGCKALDKPEGIVLQRCTVRTCAQEKEFDSCIECDELVACEKDLWDRFPDFKQKVIKMQEQYRSQG